MSDAKEYYQEYWIDIADFKKQNTDIVCSWISLNEPHYSYNKCAQFIQVVKKSELEHINQTNDSLIRQIDVLKKREEVLVNALKFYADKRHWGVVEDYDGFINYGLILCEDIEIDSSKIFECGGKLARQVLKELGVEL